MQWMLLKISSRELMMANNNMWERKYCRATRNKVVAIKRGSWAMRSRPIPIWTDKWWARKCSSAVHSRTLVAPPKTINICTKTFITHLLMLTKIFQQSTKMWGQAITTPKHLLKAILKLGQMLTCYQITKTEAKGSSQITINQQPNH